LLSHLCGKTKVDELRGIGPFNSSEKRPTGTERSPQAIEGDSNFEHGALMDTRWFD